MIRLFSRRAGRIVEVPTPAKPQPATLIDIQINGRVIVFTFERDGTFSTIETYCTMDADVGEWRRMLIE